MSVNKQYVHVLYFVGIFDWNMIYLLHNMVWIAHYNLQMIQVIFTLEKQHWIRSLSTYSRVHKSSDSFFSKILEKPSMKISWKNIENWRSWKTRFFWGGHFEFFESAILNFFLLHFSEKPRTFIWGIIFFCTMDSFSRILEKKLSELLCTRLYI